MSVVGLLARAARKEPVGLIALFFSPLLLFSQSDFLSERFRSKLTIITYHGESHDLHGCRLSRFTIDNHTNKVIGGIRIVLLRHWVVERDDVDFFVFYRNRAVVPREFKFPRRASVTVPHRLSGNVLLIPRLNPGEWLDLAVGFEHDEESELIRKRDAPDGSDGYFTPRIVNASSEDGQAIVLHHPDTCLPGKYQPENHTWRIWSSW